MITVNDDEIPLGLLDDRNSILERIADKYNTLPKYLYPIDEDFEQGQNYKIDDLLDQIRQAAQEPVLFSEFYREIEFYNPLPRTTLGTGKRIFLGARSVGSEGESSTREEEGRVPPG